VRQFQKYARGVGDSYMRDVIDLRAGEIWDRRLLEMIDAADVFQLFWSTNSMRSTFVRQEWEHALTVVKPNFVRPLYWQTPFPEDEGLPPPQLRALVFANVGIADAAEAETHESVGDDTLRMDAGPALATEAPADAVGSVGELRKPRSAHRSMFPAALGALALLLPVLFLLARC
jgi:hypothetical protein